LSANSNFYNLTLGAAMFLEGRSCAGRPGHRRQSRLQKDGSRFPWNSPTNNLTFACVLFGVIVIIAALTFFPALCLGPMVEHGLMHAPALLTTDSENL